jgi:hypothetical protein
LFGPESEAVLGPSIDGSTNVVPTPTPTPPPPGCVPGRYNLSPAPAQLMFVLDASFSMADPLSGNDPRSRWQVLRDGLAQAIVPFDSQIAMGAKFYPEPRANLNSPEEACLVANGVTFLPKVGNAQGILGVFDSTGPRGATPTSEALRIAAQALAPSRRLARAIALATDGAPDCNSQLDVNSCVCTIAGTCPARELCLDDDRTVATVKDIAEQQGIDVFVIGLGPTERPEFLAVLDRMAVAGKRPRPTTPRHYDVETSSDLATALAAVRDSASQCTYLTPSTPKDADGMTIEIDGVAIPRDPSHQDGWDWLDQTYGVVSFFGDACSSARESAKAIGGDVECDDAKK